MSDPHYTTAGGDRFCGECGVQIGVTRFDATCKPDSPCYHCLTAERDALRDAVGRVRAELAVWTDQATAEPGSEWDKGYDAAMTVILRALDGGDHA